MVYRAFLRACFVFAFLGLLALQTQAQTYTRTTYPAFEFVNSVSGQSNPTDERLWGRNGNYFVSRIIWRERNNRPCFMEIHLTNINNPTDIRNGGSINVCDGNSRSERVLDMTSPNYRRGGVSTGVTSCVNNGRLKGIRTQLREMQGNVVVDESTRRQVGFGRFYVDATFVPDITDGRRGQPDTITLRTGPRPQGPDARQFFMQERRSNCNNSNWESPSNCSNGVLTGLVAEINGRSIARLRPICGRMVLAN